MAVLAIFILLVVAAAAYYFYRKRQLGRFQPQSIRNKRVLITGSSSGIGEHLAYEYSKLGARLLLTARREPLLEKVAAKCKALGAKDVDILPGDMGSEDHLDKLVALTEKTMGGQLDHLILNHARLLNGLWTGTTEDVGDLKDIVNVNFVSYVQLASKCLPMLSKSNGHIGVVSSIAGKIGFSQSSSYSATKFALQGFFSSWRQELQNAKQTPSGVSITLCVLGFIKTEAAIDIIKRADLDVEMAEAMAASPEDTAVAILHGVTARAREVYYPRSAWIFVTMYKFCPSFVEYLYHRLEERSRLR